MRPAGLMKTSPLEQTDPWASCRAVVVVRRHCCRLEATPRFDIQRGS
jgi:hypothetical protein